MSSRCTVEYRTGRFCDTPATPYAPFPICSHHALKLFLSMDAALKAGESDRLYQLLAGFSELDEARARRSAKPAPRPVEEVVYYLLIDGIVKIGYASNLAARLTSYPPTAQVLATEPGGRELEAQRHIEFNEYLTARREWFTPGPRLRAHIEGLADYRAA